MTEVFLTGNMVFETSKPAKNYKLNHVSKFKP